jgi:hypothetical protein
MNEMYGGAKKNSVFGFLPVRTASMKCKRDILYIEIQYRQRRAH